MKEEQLENRFTKIDNEINLLEDENSQLKDTISNLVLAIETLQQEQQVPIINEDPSDMSIQQLTEHRLRLQRIKQIRNEVNI